MRKCDLCPAPAIYDARIPGKGWANLCTLHFRMFNCSLGLGRGSKIETPKEPTPSSGKAI